MDLLRKTDRKYIKCFSKKYAIKYNTLRNKYNKYHYKNAKINFISDNLNIENRGGVNKIFTETEEKELYEQIKNNFIDKNSPLTNNIIKEIASTMFIKKNNNSSFKMSDGWCTMFIKKNNNSSF